MKAALDAVMFANSPQPFMLLDEKAKPVYANPPAQRLLPVLSSHRLLWLRAYLRRLAEGLEGKPGSVQINFQQIGGCAIVSGRIGPWLEVSARTARRRKAAPSDTPNINLKLLLAERVLSLHGAKVKINRRDSMQHIESFGLSFPTSFPYAAKPDVWCQEYAVLEQSMAFARDFAILTRAHRNG
jgi:hypothetical protein